MHRTPKALQVLGLLLLAICGLSAQHAPPSQAPRTETIGPGGLLAVLWRDPGDIASRNLFYGPGGKEGVPNGRFKFVEEDRQGGTPKFDVEDDQGVRWRVKVGPEARPETAATRLLWAVGYFADEDHYLPEMRVEGMQRLSRGQKFVTEGVVRNARWERRPAGRKKLGPWSWSDNPFVGTKELDGLKVMMALLNNWDTKSSNNAIYDHGDGEHHYVVSDVGGTFGRLGSVFTRSKDNLPHYRESKFLQKTTPDHVVFPLGNVPRAHARWIGQLLARLSAEQIRDCFRASGHSPEEVEGFAKAVQERIKALNQL